LCGHGKRHRKKEWQRDFSFAPGILLVRRNRQATITLQIPQHLTISALQDYPARKLPPKPYLFIDGFNKKALDTLPNMMVNGRLTKNSREIVIPGSITTKGGAKLKVGNTVPLLPVTAQAEIRSSVRTIPYTAGRKTLAPKENRIHKIVGICQMPLFNQEESSPAFIVITTTDASDNVDNLSIFAKLKKNK
jgi:putative ABC transport system permease protein